MGQQLVIEVYEDKKLLANAYYHWGAYTHAAKLYVQKILNEYAKNPKATPMQLLESTGAEFENPDRWGGIIKTDQEEMETQTSYAVATVEIDIKNRKVNFYVFDSLDKSEYSDDELKTFHTLEETQNPYEFDFIDFVTWSVYTDFNTPTIWKDDVLKNLEY